MSLEENKKVVGNSPKLLSSSPLPPKSDSACSGGSNLNFSARTRAHAHGRGRGKGTPLLALALDHVASPGLGGSQGWLCRLSDSRAPGRLGCSGRCGSPVHQLPPGSKPHPQRSHTPPCLSRSLHTPVPGRSCFPSFLNLGLRALLFGIPLDLWTYIVLCSYALQLLFHSRWTQSWPSWGAGLVSPQTLVTNDQWAALGTGLYHWENKVNFNRPVNAYTQNSCQALLILTPSNCMQS